MFHKLPPQNGMFFFLIIKYFNNYSCSYRHQGTKRNQSEVCKKLSMPFCLHYQTGQQGANCCTGQQECYDTI